MKGTDQSPPPVKGTDPCPPSMVLVGHHIPLRQGMAQGATLANKSIVWMEEAYCPGLLCVS